MGCPLLPNTVGNPPKRLSGKCELISIRFPEPQGVFLPKRVVPPFGKSPKKAPEFLPGNIGKRPTLVKSVPYAPCIANIGQKCLPNRVSETQDFLPVKERYPKPLGFF